MRTGQMGIGEVAQRTGVRASAIRYYESVGLLPSPARSGGRRRYDESVFNALALVALAREAGFTMREIRELIRGFAPGTSPAKRWQRLATRKLAEVEELMVHAARMRAILQQALSCGCLELADCAPMLARCEPIGIDP